MHSLFTEIAIIESEIKRNDYSDNTDFFPYTNYRKLAVNYHESIFKEMAIIESEITKKILFRLCGFLSLHELSQIGR